MGHRLLFKETLFRYAHGVHADPRNWVTLMVCPSPSAPASLPKWQCKGEFHEFAIADAKRAIIATS